MKAEIPDQLKSDLPQTTWGKILTATPVVMAVIATMLAGLASSEMTKAQYDRSLAAQQQSKAGDQWSFFQAKRLRGSMQRSTLDVLQSVATVRPLTADVLGATSAEVKAALADGVLPQPPAASALDENVKAALEALEASKPEAEITDVLAKVKDETLAATLLAARERANAYDALLKPVNAGIDQLEKSLVSSVAEAARDFTVARARYAASRYDTEARLNQAIASLLELQVRKNNISAERHHARSQKFFYGMLAAQAGVIISTFSLAARKRSMLWSLAAVAGLAAVMFSLYVYLYV
jgi:hypothetical protein